MIYKVGSTGDKVKNIQRKLGILEDGIYGRVTEKEVLRWQVHNSIPGDGIVGISTWDKMFNSSSNEINNFKNLPLEKLQGKIPTNVLTQIPDTVKKFELNTPLRLSHFLGQCSHESGGFSIITENLNYNAETLTRVFRKYFPTLELAKKYERRPESIANKVYSSRMSNGNEESGDGYRYRGRGYIQLTGKHNYREFGKAINQDLINFPDKVAYDYPLLSAGWFWSVNNLNALADKGSSENIVEMICKRVNGGLNGFDDRVKYFNLYYNLLSTL